MDRMTVNGPLQASDKIFVDQSVPIYQITISENENDLRCTLEELELQGQKILIITDQHVAPYYLETIKKLAADYASEVHSFLLEPGEENKNLDTIHLIYEKLINSRFERKDWIFALGGGVIGDMSGFAAATYLRGIRFIQLPTSLLSMVDSSIGGKTGVDWKAYKNMIGAFHQPQAVYINIQTLDTLPDREFYSGFGEIIKHGLIRDIDYFEWLSKHAPEICSKDPNFLIPTIKRSCDIKKAVVEKDPTEKDERALLNFGHTVGHSIEKLMDFTLLHGECIALGILCAANVSLQKGFLTEEECQRIISVLHQYHLLETLPQVRKALQANDILLATKLDKKMQAGKIRFILLKGLGNAVISDEVTDQELLSGIQYLLEGQHL